MARLLLDVLKQQGLINALSSAGTGKSLLLKDIVARLRKIHPPGTVYVTASTGIAACQVGGITLHTFAGVGLAKYKAESLVFKVLKVCMLQIRLSTTTHISIIRIQLL